MVARRACAVLLASSACAMLAGAAAAADPGLDPAPGEDAPVQCGNTTTMCPTGGSCCPSQYSPTHYGCVLPGGADNCCKPGPALPPSTKLPNCMVIGDSVSIGYTGVATKALAGVCQVQHGPWDVSDGGAATIQNAVACLDNWLVTQAQVPVKWDVILFNSGLHNLDNSSSAEAAYRTGLANVTARLQATGAKLVYALTTPFMPDALVGDHVVEDLNAIATKIMTAANIPMLDLYGLVTAHCGKLYSDCDWCRKHPCSYHHNSVGETAQGMAVAEAIKARLAATAVDA